MNGARPSDPLRFAEPQLKTFASRIFRSVGMPDGDADVVAEALSAANLRGVDTHGVSRIPAYMKRIRAGLINLRPAFRLEARMPSIATLDADNAIGHVAARAAMSACVDAAEKVGVGVATVKRSNHFGAASVHTVPATARGCIGIALSPASPSLAPYGARAVMLGTNPLAVAAPAGRYHPWSFDLAVSVASRGKIRGAAREGRAIPEGWALDADGAPTVDPHAALTGAVLPIAGAKGSGLAMMIDILGGVLSGAAFGGTIRDWNTDFEGPSNVGHFLMALKIEAFMPLAEFEARMETEIERLKALPTAQGFDEVNYPGERSGRTAEARRRDGIPLGPEVVDELRAEAGRCGVVFPDPVS